MTQYFDNKLSLFCTKVCLTPHLIFSIKLLFQDSIVISWATRSGKRMKYFLNSLLKRKFKRKLWPFKVLRLYVLTLTRLSSMKFCFHANINLSFLWAFHYQWSDCCLFLLELELASNKKKKEKAFPKIWKKSNRICYPSMFHGSLRIWNFMITNMVFTNHLASL